MSDVEGLLSEETYTEMGIIWEYTDGMTSIMDMPQGDETWSIYLVSENSVPNSWIGSVITTMDGDTIEITADNILETIPGLFNIKHPVTKNDYMIVFTSDFDPTIVGLPADTNMTGTAAVHSSAGWGTSSISSLTEATKLSISNELLPSALQIGETGTKIEWDGTPIEPSINASNTLGVMCCKVGEPVSQESLVGGTLVRKVGENYTTYTITNDMFVDFGEIGYMIMSGSTVLASVSFVAGEYDLSMFMPGLTLEAPCAGLWFISSARSIDYTYSITGSDYQLKQLDPKYIPANLDFDLSDYYTKVEVDESISNAIHSIDSALTSAVGSGVLS